jgi:nitronate monooxygenase
MVRLPELKIGDLIAKIPIIQGGMGVGVSLSGLASAVAKEGGIGVIAAAMIGMCEKDIGSNYREANIRALTREIRKAREKTSGIIGVNIMVALNNFSDMVTTAIKEKADIIFSGAGLPLDLPNYLSKDAKTKLVPIVSSGRAAKIICKKWLSRFKYLPDGFVVEGPKAGGHLGYKPEEIDDPSHSLEQTLPEVVRAVAPFTAPGKQIPIIAAGGVYGGEDILKFLKLGASGVQMGTRFVATRECDADLAFKQAMVDAKKEDLEIIQSPVGMPGRAIRNSFLEDVKNGMRKPFKCPFHCIKTCDHTKSPYCIALALVNAKKGLLKHGFAFAGANAHRVKNIVSVHDLLESLKREFSEALKRAPELVSTAS